MRRRPAGFCPIRGVQLWVDCDHDDIGLANRPVTTCMPYNTPSGNRHLIVIRSTDYEMIILDHSEREQQVDAVAAYLNPKIEQSACFALRAGWEFYLTKHPTAVDRYFSVAAARRLLLPPYVVRLVPKARKYREESANLKQ